ncbi:hypothetical protein CSAL01_11959 [Colletotrichum salicis]|uniref:Uncharacterized protein n=1 Tax=Colletotrichum salicis TaxID=1209931 RepID=A0A135S7V7_9PEZI|nr:hypothetical protein CSAL01_11959 [Colletotrichum salicis]
MIGHRQARLSFLQLIASALLASFGWAQPSRIEQAWEAAVMSSCNNTQPAAMFALGRSEPYKETVDPILANAIGKDSFRARRSAALAPNKWRLGGFGISKQKRRGVRPGRSAM